MLFHFQARERRQQQIESNPYYLSASKSPKMAEKTTSDKSEVGMDIAKNVKDIPVSKVELGIPLILGKSSR